MLNLRTAVDQTGRDVPLWIPDSTYPSEVAQMVTPQTFFFFFSKDYNM